MSSGQNMRYVINLFGDILDTRKDQNKETQRAFPSLEDALVWIREEFTSTTEYQCDPGYVEFHGPDPEDDRITVSEIRDDGSMIVVWHFSGWHFDAEEFGIPQGCLPGDNISLYEKTLL